MTDARSGEAFERLQEAALEVIAALRSVLDLAEDAVRHPPERLAELADSVGDAMRRAAGHGTGGVPGAEGGSTPPG